MNRDNSRILLDQAAITTDNDVYLGAKDQLRIALLIEEPNEDDLSRLNDAERGDSHIFRKRLKLAHSNSFAVYLAEPDFLAGINPQRAVALYSEMLEKFTDPNFVLTIRDRRFSTFCNYRRFDAPASQLFVSDFWYIWDTRGNFPKKVGRKSIISNLFFSIKDESGSQILQLLESDSRTPEFVKKLIRLKREELDILNNTDIYAY